MNYDGKNIFIVILTSVLIGLFAVGATAANSTKTVDLRDHPSTVLEGEEFLVELSGMADHASVFYNMIENIPENFDYLGVVDNQMIVSWYPDNRQLSFSDFAWGEATLDNYVAYRLRAPENETTAEIVGILRSDIDNYLIESPTIEVIPVFEVLEGTYEVVPKSGPVPLGVTASVKVRNNADEAKDYSLTFYVDGVPESSKTLSIPADSKKEFSFTYTFEKTSEALDNHKVKIDNLDAKTVTAKPVQSVDLRTHPTTVNGGDNFLVKLDGSLSNYYDNFAAIVENVPDNFEFVEADNNNWPVTWDDENDQVEFTLTGDDYVGYWLEVLAPAGTYQLVGTLHSDNAVYDGAEIKATSLEVNPGSTVNVTWPPQDKVFTVDNVNVRWSVESGPMGIDHFEVRIDSGSWTTLADNTADNYNFTGLSDGEHTAEVRAVDGADNPVEDEVSFVVNIASPTADAGGPYSVESGGTVQLDGTGSSDPTGDPLNYSWTITDDPTGEASLTDSNTGTPTFHAPSVSSDTEVTVELTVDDGYGNSDSDEATVAVTAEVAEAAEFRVTSLTIDPEKPDPGEEVTITATVRNVGGTSGSYTAILNADPGGRIGSQTVTVNPNQTGRVSFTMEDLDPGETYEVRIGQQSGEFQVATREPAPVERKPDQTAEIAMFVGIVGIIVILIAIIVAWERER